MSQLFKRFLRERELLVNVSPRTIEWHSQSLKWLRVECPTEEDLRGFVLRMREAGLKASSCNCRIGSINAYLRWMGSPLRVPKLKQESYVPATYSAKQVALIVRWKPRGFYERRLHLLMCLLFDTGAREDEALSLRVEHCDLDNLLLTVTGKGRKQRVIPFSLELRRILARHVLDFCPRRDCLIFATRDGRKLNERNVQRDVRLLCGRLGFPPPPRIIHATRHAFATEYLRRGGSLFHLQRVLGHTTLEMVRRYAAVSTEDLRTVHERISLLRRGDAPQ